MIFSNDDICGAGHPINSMFDSREKVVLDAVQQIVCTYFLLGQIQDGCWLQSLKFQTTIYLSGTHRPSA